MRKLLLIPIILALLSLYVSQASFSYFSDVEKVNVTLAAAVTPSSVTVLYENATLTFFCHLPCCHNDDSATKSELDSFLEKAPSDPNSFENTPQCFREICKEAVLTGVYIKTNGSVGLRNITVKWWGGGKLNYLKIDNETFEVNSTSPAEIELGVTLEGGIHRLEFGFEKLAIPAFEMEFIFDGTTEEIYFIPCVKFEWV